MSWLWPLDGHHIDFNTFVLEIGGGRCQRCRWMCIWLVLHIFCKRFASWQQRRVERWLRMYVYVSMCNIIQSRLLDGSLESSNGSLEIMSIPQMDGQKTSLSYVGHWRSCLSHKWMVRKLVYPILVGQWTIGNHDYPISFGNGSSVLDCQKLGLCSPLWQWIIGDCVYSIDFGCNRSPEKLSDHILSILAKAVCAKS